MGKFINEFKEFAVKGNVVDMAVGVIIGGAFGKIVTSLVNDIIMPAIGKITGGISFADLKYDGIMKAGAVMIVDTMTEGMAENQHLAGVACLRIDNSYRITDNTTSIIRITEIK